MTNVSFYDINHPVFNTDLYLYNFIGSGDEIFTTYLLRSFDLKYTNHYRSRTLLKFEYKVNIFLQKITPLSRDLWYQVLGWGIRDNLIFSKIRIFWKGQKIHFSLTLLNNVKKVEDYFKCVLPSQNIWTLTNLIFNNTLQTNAKISLFQIFSYMRSSFFL